MTKNKQSPTIKDIANRAGVSVGTVSNYLNNTARISEQTSQAIEQVIQELGYQPNLTARSLRMQQTQSLGLVVPNISNPFFSEIARLVSQYAWQAGFQMFLCNSDNDAIREKTQLQTLYQRQVDGVIIIHSGIEQIASIVTAASTPTIFIDRHVHNHYSIVTDNELGGRLSLQHLIELGHRRIAIISGDKHVYNVQERLSGAYQVLNEYGIDLPAEYIIDGAQALETGLQAKQLWQLPEPPTAVFTSNDIIAIGVWHSCLAHQLAVPQQVSIIGYDNIQWSALTVPALTTIAQDISTICHRAIEMISDVMHAGKTLQASIEFVKPKLIVRGSTQPP
ncbi:MAG: LacI family DNA-binding transcriptional regulator [Armatimonadetes bacterium]|nr:LacI family DNA-binding transcriptional regulator [Anaerolineae bacterium]